MHAERVSKSRHDAVFGDAVAGKLDCFKFFYDIQDDKTMNTMMKKCMNKTDVCFHFFYFSTKRTECSHLANFSKLPRRSCKLMANTDQRHDK